MGSVYQGARKSEFLFHAARQFAGLAFLERFNLTVYIFYQMVVFFYGGVEYSGKERQVFLYRQILIQREASRHISDVLPYLLVILHHIKTIDHGSTGVCKEQGRENSEQRGLSGSVGAYQSEYLTFSDIEGTPFRACTLPLS